MQSAGAGPGIARAGEAGLPPELAIEPDRPPLTLAQMERVYIERVVRSVGGHRREAAAILGISERSLYRKLEEIARGDHGEGEGGA